ncbi:hypothetical protein AOLI_G00096530 [Acnodon oligacanthus]
MWERRGPSLAPGYITVNEIHYNTITVAFSRALDVSFSQGHSQTLPPTPSSTNSTQPMAKVLFISEYSVLTQKEALWMEQQLCCLDSQQKHLYASTQTLMLPNLKFHSAVECVK